jgi:uncharacterized membrane protein (DUF485 family)
VSTDAPQRSQRQEPVYEDLAATPDFHELRKRYRGFVFPATVAFLSWYLLYVFMSMWAQDFMSTEVIGHINVALIFGLLQFATTFLLAWLYSNFSTAKLDPLARKLNDEYDATIAGADGRSH